jgi:transposase
MESQRKIRVLYRKCGSIKEVSRRTGISLPTVRKIIKSEEALGVGYKRCVQQYPKLGGYKETLEKLLRDNRFAKPQRTGKMLFEDLQDLGYRGSYSAVNRYIGAWKERTSKISHDACIPLSFAPGEAFQFDWSSENVIICDEVVSVKAAHFTLCYSGKKFTYIYPNETQEMVFDAHVRAFQFFGGTPVRGIYDNMTTAVKKVLKGKEREWNPKFERLCAHYRIEPTACTPGRGNEKGRVERQVGIDRDQFFTPMPKGSTLQELNDRLMSQLTHYNNTHKHPTDKSRTLEEVFAQESPFLVPAPILFDGCKETTIKVSNTCLAMFDRNSYSVQCACAGKIVQCKSYADRLIFIYGGKEVGQHIRKFTKGGTYYDWRHYLPLLARKPGALRNGSPFTEMPLPDELLIVQNHLQQHPHGIRDFAHILSYIPAESMESVVTACATAIKSETISKDMILNILLRKKDQPDNTAEPPPIIDMKLKYTPTDDCSHYDQLLKTGGRL